MKRLAAWNKNFNRFVFFMAFPGIILFVNVSMYFFVGLFLISRQRYSRLARSIKTEIPFLAIFFGIGAAISVLLVPSGWGGENFRHALLALPNYIYWVMLIVFLNRYRSIVDYNQVSKFVFYGVSFYLPFWFLSENYLEGIPLFQKTTPNNLAFLMIAYSPMAISYVSLTFSRNKAKLYFLAILLVMLFLGRRAGFVLVLIGGILTLFVKSFTFSSFLKYGLVFTLFWFVLQFSVFEEVIRVANPRVYQLVYDRDELVSEDRSYLTRVAMIEKGIDLFNEYPFSGVGITNFHRTEGHIAGDFEGYELIRYKLNLNELSAHNSYVSVLSEGGLVLFAPWILIMLSILVRFSSNLSNIESKYYPLFWGCLGMFFHYTSIVGYVNVYSWFIIAMCGVVLSRIGEEHVNSLKPINRAI
jgi:O-antigen ligase